MDVDGRLAPGFEAVACAFERSFDELGEVGAAVAVYHEGRLVVDLAGGSDPVRDRVFTCESGPRAFPGQERDPRGVDALSEGPSAGIGSVRREGTPVAG
jgi:hypothetical protein